MTYAVKTLECLFTWSGHERYPMMMEFNQSSNHTWKATNVVMYCDTRTDAHINTHTHTLQIIIYIIITAILILAMIRRINDFAIINLVHITPIEIISNRL